MARSWLCHIGALKAAFNTFESVISHESDVVRSKSLKEDSAATARVCRASNEKACRIEQPTRRMWCEDSAHKSFLSQYEYDFAFLMPFLRLLHCYGMSKPLERQLDVACPSKNERRLIP